MDEKFVSATTQFLQQKLSDATVEAANYYGQLQLALARIAELEAQVEPSESPVEAMPES